MSLVRIVHGTAEVTLEATETQYLDGKLHTDYNPEHLLIATAEALQAIGELQLASHVLQAVGQ